MDLIFYTPAEDSSPTEAALTAQLTSARPPRVIYLNAAGQTSAPP
jgi:hypothetical protein